MPLFSGVDQILQDLRAGGQILTRSPGLCAAAVVLMALVIGGNTTVFSIAHGILTKPAPAVRATDMVTLTWVRDDGFIEPGTSYANYQDIAAQAETLQSAVAFEYDRFALNHEDGTHAVWAAFVSPNYFATLDVPLLVGRSFTAEESESGASGLLAVISDRAWEDYFQRRPGIVGTPIALNGRPATVIGVVAPPFRGTLLVPLVDVWIPLSANARSIGRSLGANLDERREFTVSIQARLRPDASLAQARSEVAAIWARLQATYPEVPRNLTATVVPYSATAGGNSAVATQGDTFLALFSVVTALTLIIVCANVANLLLGRTVIRQRELAVRRSLGASRARIARMLLAEGFVIAIIAWGVAWVCASWMTRISARLIAPGTPASVPLLVSAPDRSVAAYALVLALGAMVAFTVAPAVRAWRQPLLPWLKAGEHGVVQGRSRLSSGLVVLQLAFSVLLLTIAGLAYRSVFLLGTSDLGFDPRGLLLATVNTAGGAADRETNAVLLERFRERLRAVPGVQAVSYARSVPRDGPWGRAPIRTSGSAEPILAEPNHVGPGWLEVHGLAPLAGRELDRESGRGVPSAVVNRDLAAMLWPGQSAIGRRVLLGGRGGTREAEIVGVAPDAFVHGFRREPRPRQIFLSAPQEPEEPGETTFYVRHGSTLEQITPAMGRALREVDARVPLVALRTLDAQLENTIWPIRVLTLLLSLFAGGSLLIAAIGQYAVVAFDMRRRTRDFGVRIAIGASSSQILGSVLKEGAVVTAAGLLVGFALSVAVALALQGVLFGVTPTDPVTYAGVFGLLTMLSLVACYVPARRAARVDPVQALRQE